MCPEQDHQDRLSQARQAVKWKMQKSAIQTVEVDSRFRGNDDTRDAHPESRHSRESGNPPLGLAQRLQLQRKTSERTSTNFLALPGETAIRRVAATKCRFAARPWPGNENLLLPLNAGWRRAQLCALARRITAGHAHPQTACCARTP